VRKEIETTETTSTGHAAEAVPLSRPPVTDSTTESRRVAPSAERPRPRWLVQLASFGLVGGIAFVVDVTVYNIVRATVLEDSPIWSKVVSVAIATTVAWIGNRYLTFRRDRSPRPLSEAMLFAIVNVAGLLIAAGCLFVSHYVLGFASQLADNISGNGVGLVLGTAFRFVAYRWLVFSPRFRMIRIPRVTHRTARLNTPARLETGEIS
jgi:putative flippase GtrA